MITKKVIDNVRQRKTTSWYVVVVSKNAVKEKIETHSAVSIIFFFDQTSTYFAFDNELVVFWEKYGFRQMAPLGPRFLWGD